MLPYVASGGLGPSSVPVDVTCNRLNRCQDWIICFQGRVGQGIEWNINTLEGFTVRNLLLKSAKIWDKSFFRPSVNAQRINVNILLQSLFTKEQGRIFHLQELICFVKFMTVTPHPHQRFEHRHGEEAEWFLLERKLALFGGCIPHWLFWA